MRSSYTVRVLSTLAVLIASACSFAQSYPARAVKVIVPFAPGTGTDAVVRIVSDGLSKRTGKPFVIENRTGAGGTIGAALVAKASADGYTILGNAASHTSVPALMKDIPFDTAQDLAGVTMLTDSPVVLVIARSRGIRTVQELVAAAKAKPGSITFASGGLGTTPHLAAEQFRLAAGFDALHVPFKSGAEALTELIAGRIDFTYTSLNAALPLVQDGRLIALAMSSRRSALFPNVPTIEEGGVAGGGCCSSWIGLFVPSKTPRDIVNHLYEETLRVIAGAEQKDRLNKIGAEPYTMRPEEFDAFIRRELAANARIVKALNIQPQ